MDFFRVEQPNRAQHETQLRAAHELQLRAARESAQNDLRGAEADLLATRLALQRAEAEVAELNASLAAAEARSDLRRCGWKRAAVTCLVVLAAREALPLSQHCLNAFNAAAVAVSGRPAHCAARPYGALVLEGGGVSLWTSCGFSHASPCQVKGIAYGGAAAALEAHGLLKPRRLNAFAGTSAGYTPASYTAGYTADSHFVGAALTPL
jgi:hypothetical protein